MPDWQTFLYGVAGALLVVYLVESRVIPQFRSFWDVSQDVADEKLYRERNAKIRSELDRVDSQKADSLIRELTANNEMLIRVSRKVSLNGFVSRLTGIVFYLLLGGLFAVLFSDEVNIAPDAPEVNAILIGSVWTSIANVLGFRGKTEDAAQLGEIMGTIQGNMQTLDGQLGGVQSAVKNEDPLEATNQATEAIQTVEKTKANAALGHHLTQRLKPGEGMSHQ